MRALITGATGFVGAHLTAHLVRSGDQVLGVSRSARWRSAVGLYPELRDAPILRWDIRTPADESLREQILGFDPEVIYHLAAISIPADCGAPEPTDAAIQTNVEGTRHVLDLALQCTSRVKFLLASSCHVYGPPAEENDIVTEACELRPGNGYGVTKQMSERLLADAARARLIQAVSLRGFQQTGPLQSDRMLLPEWTRQFAERKPTIAVRSLETTLDLMDVRDSVRSYRELAIADLSTFDGDALHVNVGSGQRSSGQQIIDALQGVAGYEATIEESAPARRRNPIADVNRLHEIIEFEPKYQLSDTIADTYDYWRERLVM